MPRHRRQRCCEGGVDQPGAWVTCALHARAHTQVWNGRWAMVGMLLSIVAELRTGSGTLEQLGFTNLPSMGACACARQPAAPLRPPRGVLRSQSSALHRTRVHPCAARRALFLALHLQQRGRGGGRRVDGGASVCRPLDGAPAAALRALPGAAGAGGGAARALLLRGAAGRAARRAGQRARSHGGLPAGPAHGGAHGARRGGTGARSSPGGRARCCAPAAARHARGWGLTLRVCCVCVCARACRWCCTCACWASWASSTACDLDA